MQRGAAGKHPSNRQDQQCIATRHSASAMNRDNRPYRQRYRQSGEATLFSAGEIRENCEMSGVSANVRAGWRHEGDA
jgi:hypothetical protein